MIVLYAFIFGVMGDLTPLIGGAFGIATLDWRNAVCGGSWHSHEIRVFLASVRHNSIFVATPTGVDVSCTAMPTQKSPSPDRSLSDVARFEPEHAVVSS